MTARRMVLLGAVVLAAGAVWRAQLFEVDRSSAGPRPLTRTSAAPPASFDVVLPAVPVGMRRLRPGEHVMLVHYWAPWERHGRAQAVALDSLVRSPGLEGLEAVLVCFDPFPSVARFVGRARLQITVLLDHEGALRSGLACPRLPFTYVLDRSGRIVVAQAGEIDWDAPATRRLLIEVLAGAPPARAPGLSMAPARIRGARPEWPGRRIRAVAAPG